MPWPLPRRAGREVQRPQQPRVAVDIADDLAPVPDVVAGGDDVDAAVIELGADLVGDAEAVRGVLAVDDDEIEPSSWRSRGMCGDDRVAPGPPHHVAAQQQPHRASTLGK